MRQIFSKFRNSERGASAIEFALIAPIVLVLLAAVVDFGLLLQNRSSMEAATSSAMSYALAKGQDLKADNAVSYVATVAEIASRQLGGDVEVDITLNRTLVALKTGAGLTQSGSGGAANLCYCPTRRGAAIDWGNSVACTATCPAGGLAGRFLAIKVVRPYQTLFFDYGIASDGTVTVETLAGLQ